MTKVAKPATHAEAHSLDPQELDRSWLELARQLEEQRWQAMLEANAERLSELVSDDLWYVHSSGLKDGKQGYIDALRTGAVVYQTSSRRIDTVVSLGENAFLAGGSVTMEIVLRGTPKLLESLFSVVWRQESGVWRLAGHQTTLLPR